MEVQQRPVILVGAGALGILSASGSPPPMGQTGWPLPPSLPVRSCTVPLSSDATESPVYFGSWMMWPMPPRRG